MDVIRVGVLHSLSGALALSERPVAEATRMAIEAINEKGGIAGRWQIIAIYMDGESVPSTFAMRASQLLSRNDALNGNCSVIFGGWTSASRKAMIPVVEAANSLLFYPVQVIISLHSIYLSFSFTPSYSSYYNEPNSMKAKSVVDQYFMEVQVPMNN
jgi:ABC-type branched-subunit amino acid transport system substrate-binding protein